MKKENGITLVALVITIIVLVILATVSIILVLNQNGMFSQVNQAKELSKINDYKEKIELILYEERIKNYTEQKAFTIASLIERYNTESFVGNAERIDLEETENKGTIRIITTDGYIYEVVIEENNIYCVSQGKEDGEPYPTISLEQLPMQGIENEEIQIKVTATVSGGKETTGITQIERVDNKEKKDYTEGGVVFEVEENGTYTFSATTNKGKSKIAKIKIQVEQPKETIKITANPTTVTNQEVEVTIQYGETTLTNSDKYQYKIGTEGSWETVTSNTITTSVNKNTIIVARYYDGKNSFKVQNYNIQNIDKIAPNAFNYTTSKTTNSITITGSATDTGSIGCASGNIGIEKQEYSKDNGATWQTGNSFNNLTTGSYTVKTRAIDKAGNITNGNSASSKAEAEIVTLGTVETGDITITPSITAPTNGNVTVTINYGNSGYTRQYKKSTDANWTTVTGTSINFTVSENIAIAVRYFDGTNSFNGTSYNIQNIDKSLPTMPNVNLNGYVAGNWTNTNITIALTSTDTGSQRNSKSTYRNIKISI